MAGAATATSIYPNPKVPQPTNPEGPSHVWPLRQIKARGLFGEHDLTLTLDPLATVFTGQNGSGKSTILRAVDYVSREQWQALARLPIEELSLGLADGGELRAELSSSELTISDAVNEWTFDLEVASQFEPHVVSDLTHVRRRLRTQPQRRHHQFVMQSQLLRHGRGISEEDLEFLIAPEWLADVAGAIQTKYISARRLEHRLRPERDTGEDAPVPVVEQYAEELRARMRDQLSDYASESRKQEKNLPMKIVDAMQGEAESAEVLAADVESLQGEVKDLASSLARVGLLYEEDPQEPFAEYPKEKPEILLAIREVYRVTKIRLERLTALRSELEFFSSFLNSRLSGKQIELNQEDGISVVLSTGERISPNHLSSGEQQLLALAYQLLFESSPQTLVLVDEPELSLHVGWQKGLLSAFLEMAERLRLQFVIATHSPSVIASHRDLERSLDVYS
jgi:energy-coupling factor transporter ATP-binding protein EcfA2